MMVRVRWARTAAVLGASTAVLAFGSGAASAATDPYSQTPYGYDVSYPQCPGGTEPAAPPGESYTFAIVGVGGGRPFTSNSCAGTEAATAAGVGIANVAYYFNTGYAGAYGRDINSTCSSDVSNGNDDGVFAGIKGHVLAQDQKAWEIGCSEALYAQANAPAPAPTMWWADVETGNSWSTNTSLNQFALDGMSYFMSTKGGGGFYSSPSMWAKITGSSSWDTTPAMSGSWVAGTSSCSGAALVGTGAWLVQGGLNGGLDQDTAC